MLMWERQLGGVSSQSWWSISILMYSNTVFFLYGLIACCLSILHIMVRTTKCVCLVDWIISTRIPSDLYWYQGWPSLFPGGTWAVPGPAAANGRSPLLALKKKIHGQIWTVTLTWINMTGQPAPRIMIIRDPGYSLLGHWFPLIRPAI